MTPAQIAELEKLNAAVEAAPDEVEHYGRRAYFLARNGGDFDLIVADETQVALSPLDVTKAARAAGRVMLEQMELRLNRGEDFALESTLASRSLAPFIERCKGEGYQFTLIYVWLRSADLAVQRVARRVESGGHDIPEGVIRRRFERGRANFFELYLPLANRWSAWDNSGGNSVEVARGSFGTEEILQPDTWEIISI